MMILRLYAELPIVVAEMMVVVIPAMIMIDKRKIYNY